jgi:hypothetical protein
MIAMRLLLVTAAITATLAIPAAADVPCSAANFMTGCATATTSDFRGAILVPGSDAANAAVARSHGCDGCAWTLVLNCDRNTTNDPEWVSCNAARCPEGSLFRLYLQRPEDARPEYVDTICLSTTRRVVTAAEVAVDAARYLTDLAPPALAIGVQPEGRAVTRLATFLYARGATHDSRTLTVGTAAGPARLTIDIAPSEYRWSFGDEGTCTTAEPGGTYDGTSAERCDDRVAHLFAAAGRYPVRLDAVWGGTFSFDVGYGAVGPRPIPGDGVAGPVATRVVDVRDARAELIGG